MFHPRNIPSGSIKIKKKFSFSSGYLGPLTIYLFFTSATIINRILITKTIPLVAEQEKREGDLRFFKIFSILK